MSSVSVVIVYFSILFLIGFLSGSHGKNDCDFNLGGRKMNLWTTALSAHASDMSAWLFMALPMLIYTQGATQMWLAFGLFLGMGMNWLWIAKKLRLATEKAGAVTLPSWFSKAYNDSSGRLSALCAIVSIVFMFHYLAAGLIAMGVLFEEIFSLPYHFSIVFSLLAIILYTLKGGYTAVGWIDLFQGCFLLIVILFVPFFVLFQGSGIDHVVQVAHSKSIALNPFSLSFKESIQALVIALTWGLGYMGMPHILSKFMGIKHPSHMKRAMIVGMSWHALALFGAIAVGLVAIGFYQDGLQNEELVFIKMVNTSFSSTLSSVIFCAILAANISTMDSQLLVGASNLSDNCLRPICQRLGIQVSSVALSRIAIVILASIALLVALLRSQSVQSAVLFSWSGLGAAFGPLVLASLYIKSLRFMHAASSLFASFFVVCIWDLFLGAHLESRIGFNIPPLLPGFIAGLLAIGVCHIVMRYTRSDLSSDVKL